MYTIQVEWHMFNGRFKLRIEPATNAKAPTLKAWKKLSRVLIHFVLFEFSKPLNEPFRSDSQLTGKLRPANHYPRCQAEAFVDVFGFLHNHTTLQTHSCILQPYSAKREREWARLQLQYVVESCGGVWDFVYFFFLPRRRFSFDTRQQ